VRQAYIAGRYSGTPEEIHAHVLLAVEAAPRVMAAGWLPIIPHVMGPHRDTTWTAAMDRCRYLIRCLDPARGDILVALPNWRDSPGAREEVILAGSLGIRVVPLADL
jgi:hypothetical protein